jgi:hypothetical protein
MPLISIQTGTAGKRTPPHSYKREFRKSHTSRCVWELSPYKSVIQCCSALPAADSKPRQNAELPCLFFLSYRTSLQLYPAEYGFGNDASQVPPFVSRFAILCVWVYVSAFFSVLHDTTRWPSQKIPICCCMLKVTETSFLASGDASFCLSFLVLLVKLSVSYLLTTLLRRFCTKFTSKQFR